MTAATPLVCSAKACRLPASDAVIWRNPRIHTEQRRKVWVACPDHVEQLRAFVDLRGFLIEVLLVDDLGPGDG